MSVAPNKLRKPVVAVQRAVQIMRFLGATQSPVGVSEVARALGIVPSTCLNILKTLDHDGLVSEDKSNKKYQLGPALLRFARDMVGSNEFVRNVQIVLDQIAKRHMVTTVAVWHEGADRIIVVAKANPPTNFSIHVDVGSRFPAYTSAIGYCFAANMEGNLKNLRGSFEKLKWQNPLYFEDWIKAVVFVRERGYAVDNGHHIRGVTVIAAPVFSADSSTTRAIAGVGLDEQLKGAARTALAEDLKTSAATLSETYSASII